MITRFSIIFYRAPRRPPGKGVVRMVGIIFHLFLWLLSPIEGEVTYVIKMSEGGSKWVIVTIEFLSLYNSYSMFTVLRSTIEDDKHLPIISGWRMKKQSFFFFKKHRIRCDRRIMKNPEENFFLWRGSTLPFEYLHYCYHYYYYYYYYYYYDGMIIWHQFIIGYNNHQLYFSRVAHDSIKYW